MFKNKMFKKNNKDKIEEKDINNKWEKIINNKKEKAIKKDKKETKTELWPKNKINFKNDIIEELSNRQIITWKELKEILTRKKNWVKYEKLIDFLDDVIEIFWTEKENEILDLFFADKNINNMWYNVIKKSDSINISTTLLDLFNTNSTSSLLQKEIDDILNSWTIPIQIINENKVNKIVIISRSIEIPKNLLNIYKPIIEKKKILDMSFILVNKQTFEDLKNQLINTEFWFSL